MTWLTAMVLLSVPASERLVVMPWVGSGVTTGVSDFAASRFGELLQERGRAVTTAEQMIAVLGFERQKQLLQCGTESRSCLVELSNAMGARLLALGRITKLGTHFELDVRVLDATTGARVAGARQTADSEDALSGALSHLAADVVAELSGEPAPALVGTAESSTAKSSPWPIVTASTGLAMLAAGVVCTVWGQVQLNRLTSPTEQFSILRRGAWPAPVRRCEASASRWAPWASPQASSVWPGPRRPRRRRATRRSPCCSAPPRSACR